MPFQFDSEEIGSRGISIKLRVAHSDAVYAMAYPIHGGVEVLLRWIREFKRVVRLDTL